MDPGPQATDGRAASPIGLTLWLFLTVLWVTWYPFRLRSGEPDVALWPAFTLLEVAGNLLLFAPIGVTVALSGYGSVRQRVVHAIAIVAGLSLVVETGQWFVEGRTVSLIDLTLNGMGAALAAGAAVLLARRFAKERLCALVVSAVFIGVAAHQLLPALSVGPRSQLEGWNAEYVVLSGDEVGGERTYVGVISQPEVCAGLDAQRVCAQPFARAETRQRLTETAIGAQRISASARVISASDRQDGPTRIVTFSAGTGVRNLTLGQSGRRLVLRIRTPLTGPNAHWVQFTLADAIRAGEPTHVRAHYDRGEVTLTAVAEGRNARGEFLPGLLQSWLLYRERFISVKPFLNVELSSSRAQVLLSAGVLFMPLGLLAGTLRRRSWVAAITAAILASVVLYSVDAFVARPPGRDHVFFAAAWAALGAGLCLLDGVRLRPLRGARGG